MFKIRKVKFYRHPILQDLELDFCDKEGKAADTIIFAGENGSGKSTILDVLYSFFNMVPGNEPKAEARIELEKDGSIETLSFFKENGSTLVDDGKQLKRINFWFKRFREIYPFKAIYSDVDINFRSQPISNVTSMALDTSELSRRSEDDLPTQIKQLLIDIQDLDDSSLAKSFRHARKLGESTDSISVDDRMSRFTNAFNMMFDQLSYEGVDNVNGAKHVFFKKHGKNIPIDDLSSGEKQIVYRGGFLLKDLNSLNGAFVFIDEPEISLHPNWQKKIMDFYKKIFTDGQGKQTSQIFAVTHSPFIIHNENRRNDKVLVIKRDEQGKVVVMDNPQYYKCLSQELVEDAFSLPGFSSQNPTVYVEGKTDEMYFNSAIEAFNLQVPFSFKSVGVRVGNNKEEINAGKDNLLKAFYFLVAQNLAFRNACLFDCDTNHQEKIISNVMLEVLPKFNHPKKIKAGIENALVLDSINLDDFKREEEKLDEYGFPQTIRKLKKIKLCEHICSLPKEDRKVIFKNLEKVILNLNEKITE